MDHQLGLDRVARPSTPGGARVLIPSRKTLALALALAPFPAASALAHPHVFVVAKEDLLFTPDGRVSGVRAHWTFDDMYSSFLTQGIGDPDKLPTRDELAPLAQTNVDSLAEFGYFTVVKVAGVPAAFDPPTDYFLEESAEKLVTLHFTLPLKDAASAKVLTLQVYDPTYFVSFEFDDHAPLALVGAPSGCSANVNKPKPLDAGDNQKLSEAFFANLSPGVDFGIRMASRAVVACP